MNAIDTKKLDESRDAYVLESMMRDFVDRWHPADAWEAAEFNTALFMLVRRIYLDASQQANKPVMEILSTLSLTRFIPELPK